MRQGGVGLRHGRTFAGVVRADWLTRQSGKVGDPSLRLKNGYAQDDAGV
jgi:hypothetical protein